MLQGRPIATRFVSVPAGSCGRPGAHVRRAFVTRLQELVLKLLGPVAERSLIGIMVLYLTGCNIAFLAVMYDQVQLWWLCFQGRGTPCR